MNHKSNHIFEYIEKISAGQYDVELSFNLLDVVHVLQGMLYWFTLNREYYTLPAAFLILLQLPHLHTHHQKRVKKHLPKQFCSN